MSQNVKIARLAQAYCDITDSKYLFYAKCLRSFASLSMELMFLLDSNSGNKLTINA
jgi:hypothetical protein